MHFGALLSGYAEGIQSFSPARRRKGKGVFGGWASRLRLERSDRTLDGREPRARGGVAGATINNELSPLLKISNKRFDENPRLL